tara:strand:+ start:569 stop:2662 length:2094 start_codon:yes stop_codon:yes gene_type:complete
MKKTAIILSFIISVNAQKASTLEFDGTDDYVDLGVVELTNFTSDDFSIQVWVKTTSEKAQSILIKGDGDEVWEAGEKALYIEASGYPWFVGYDNNYIPGTGLKVNDGLWHHIVVTWDYSGSGVTKNDGTAAIYVDGVKATVANSYRAQTGDNPNDKLFLAKKNGKDAEAPNYFDGALAEVAIWDKALSSSDITSLYSKYSQSYGIGDRYSPEDASFYWKMNDGTGDTTINFVNKEIKNLYFDGVDDWIQTKNGFGEEDHPIPDEGDFAVSVWAKASSNSSGLMEIISQGEAGSNFYLGSHHTGDKIRAGDSFQAGTFPRDDKWHHYVVSKSASNTHLYLDGALVASKGSAIGNPINGTGLRIGRQYGTAGEYFYGSIAEVVILDDTLTMVEVQSLYNGGVPSNPMIDTYHDAGTVKYDSKDNITIYYPLNEGKDLVVYGNEYNNSEVFTGEIQGMATASWASDSWRSSNGAIYGATWVNYPPSAFKWADSKKDTINITKENLATSYTFEWTKSTDFDGVSYMLQAKIGSTPWQVINEDIEGTSFESIYQEFLEGAFEPFPTVNAVAVAFTMDVTDGIDTTKMDDDPKLIYIRRYDYLSTVDDQIPTDFTLHENYPNPFNPTTTLRFDIPEISDVTVTIYNMIGQKIKSFNMQSAPAGYHSLTWDATNDLGAPVAAGVYLYQLQTEGFIKTKKMVLLK